jgi:hypothetical protein
MTPDNREDGRKRPDVTRDYALVIDKDGRLALHRADCPTVKAMEDNGEPVLTMRNCAHEPSDKLPRHSCLDHGR